MSAAPYIHVRERAAEKRTTTKSPARRNPLRVEQAVSVHRAKTQQFGLSTAEFLAAQAVLFTVFAAASFMASVLVGNTLGELERRKAVDARSQVRLAQADMVRLRQRYDRLNNAADIGDWASARGFVAAYGIGAENGIPTKD